MNHSLRVALCHSATARAHLAGAEAAELEALASKWNKSAQRKALTEPPVGRKGGFVDLMFAATTAKAYAAAARRRYWREVSAVQLLMGHRWPEAEALGVESNG